MQRVGDRAGAVVAAVLPLAVAAAVVVRRLGDLVARGDDLLDDVRRVGRRDREAVGADGRLGARRGLRGGVGVVEPVACVVASPATSERSRSMSLASMTPSTVSCWSVSNCLTDLTVPAPYSPSIDVSKPARWRKSWRIRTSWPLMPFLSGMRSPRCCEPPVERTSKPPEELELAEPSVALLSAVSVLASATPEARRLAARWNLRTTVTVPRPYWPSVDGLEAGGAEQRLQRLDARAVVAGAQRLGADLAGRRGGRGDGGRGARRARARWWPWSSARRSCRGRRSTSRGRRCSKPMCQRRRRPGRTTRRPQIGLRLRRTSGTATATTGRYPSICGAYGVSCRARANRAALLRGVSR